MALKQQKLTSCPVPSMAHDTAKIVLDREPIRSEIVKDRWLRCPLEQPRRRRAFYEARRKQFIEMAVGTHEVSNLAGRRSRANRKAYRCAVSCCIGAGRLSRMKIPPQSALDADPDLKLVSQRSPYMRTER